MTNSDLQQLSSDFFQNSLDSSPTSAIMRGHKQYFDQIEELNEETFEKETKAVNDFISRLESIDTESLSNREKVTHGMLEFALSSNKDSLMDRSWEFGAGVSGFTGFLIDYNQQMFVPDSESADMLLKRLELYKRLYTQIAEVQKIGLKNNRVATERNLLRTIDQLENYLGSSLEEDPLLLVNFSPEISESFISDWKEKAKKIIDLNIRPTVLAYLEQLKSDHIPKGRPDEHSGIMWIDGGEETYLRALRKYTGHKNITVKEVHEVGLSEIERLKKEFFEIGENVFPGVSTPEEVLQKMQTEPSMRYESKEQMLQLAVDTIERAYKPLDQWFTVFPKSPCKVLPVPAESEQHAPPAYYYPPLPDGSRDGTYFLNTYKAETKSIFEAESVAFHEAIPGHHLDRTIAVELQDVPDFQKYVASTAFVEGWGLYSEQLANEMGLYSNDVQQLGRLGNDAWRACRLVLDTGMHGMGWSRDKAIEFFRANSPIEEINSEIETDRYIAWPGQACSYKMGQLKIEELRRKAEIELGDKFDIRYFHDEVLCDGGITLPILENKIDTFIAQHKS
ncbi:MAG: DUF885 domain-containing protein [Candidatus Actinomarinales bacterium]|nr:MAG: DUF885 domain-containing protein [Candidatus Actinomarinales bacterium]|tara:strand:+ start:1269 stop:2960 length:1692 start_codon:yes stop_codon:yes gene_type:complete